MHSAEMGRDLIIAEQVTKERIGAKRAPGGSRHGKASQRNKGQLE